VMMFGLKGVGASVKIGSHTGRVSGLCFAQDGRTIASCSHDWTVQVWDLERGCRVRGGFRGHAGRIVSLPWLHMSHCETTSK
jgi:WD40 repeat protein